MQKTETTHSKVGAHREKQQQKLQEQKLINIFRWVMKGVPASNEKMLQGESLV